MVHNYSGTAEEAWEAFVQELEALPADLKVIGINDYTGWNGRWKGIITRDSLADLGQMVIYIAPPEKRADYASPLQEGLDNLCVSLEKLVETLDKHYLAGIETMHMIKKGRLGCPGGPALSATDYSCSLATEYAGRGSFFCGRAFLLRQNQQVIPRGS